jgi:hypothetical protein
MQVIEFQVEPARTEFERELRRERHPTVHHREIHRHAAREIVADAHRHAGDRFFDHLPVMDDDRVLQRFGQRALVHAMSPPKRACASV